jgi:tetraacyldisaccharide 4'-kinase
MSALDDAWRDEGSWLSAALSPLSLMYRAGAAMDRARKTSRRVTIGRPVVSVGNLVAGGAGKTPVVAELAKRLISKGKRVVVASRGYGRAAGEAVQVVTPETSVSAAGDEPAWLVRRVPGLVAVVSSDRVAAAERAVTEGADVVLLDDGFSTHALHRDADVLCVDAELGFGNRRLLPAGPLREPVSQANRATLVWLTRVPSSDFAPPPELTSRPLVRSTFLPEGLSRLDLTPAEPLTEVTGMRVLGVSGVARPASFEATLRGAALELAEIQAFPDHHRFTEGDVARLESKATALGARLILTTEKDAMRLADLTRDPRWRAVRMALDVVGDDAALTALVGRFA